MKNRFVYLGMVAAALFALYMMVPACGNNNGSTTPYTGYGYGTTCIPGQVCTSSGVAGVPLTPTPAIGLLDNYGSNVQLSFGGSSLVAGQVYSGTVNISGILTIVQGGFGGLCPPGQYQVTGTGQWQSGAASSVGVFSAQLQAVGGAYGGMQLAPNTVRVLSGQDPYNPQNTSGYYMWGNFPLSCDSGAVVN